MGRIKNYLSSNFTKTFSVIFLPFFAIVSLVYFIRISVLTAQIQLNFLELFELYGYFLPSILFYTLPISFITAIALVLVRLSQDNELNALYALGISSSNIIKKYLLLAMLFSILLFSISFFAMPMTKQMYNAFRVQKLSEAKLNINAASLGQKFDDYYLYIGKQIDDEFHDIVIYNPNGQTEEKIFISKSGQILNDPNEQASFILKDGYGYTYYKNNLQQFKFQTLRAYDTSSRGEIDFESILHYWSQIKSDDSIMKRALFFIFVSFIPLLSLYSVAAFTMINPRYQSNRSFIVIFAISLISYAFASFLEIYGNIYWLLGGILLFLAIGWRLFGRLAARHF
ncbi:MAG: LptF/LptG family permease [Sulfurovaceae bacterium]|nr:LptF/LptG family permease [Sulfurovaceae bacterium]